MVQEVEETIAAMGEDFWPYGIARTARPSMPRRVGRSSKAFHLDASELKSCSLLLHSNRRGKPVRITLYGLPFARVARFAPRSALGR